MSKKPRINENYRHECTEPTYELDRCRCALSEIYTPEEFTQLVGFYMLTLPEKNSGGNAYALSDYGWAGHGIGDLEGRLLKSAGMSQFVFLGSRKIDGTLEAMKLGGTVCAQHPRAVLMRKATLTMDEDGSTKAEYKGDNRMQCLMRHIRNGIAHGLSFAFPTGTVLLEDMEKKSVTARILLKRETLLDWIPIVKNGPSAKADR